jgi:Domain of unknown function (DUF4326)
MPRRVHIPTERKAGRPYEPPEVGWLGHHFTRGYYNLEPSDWKNPHYKLRDTDPQLAVDLYRDHVLASENLMGRLEAGELDSIEVFGCFCPLDQPCHVDVVIELLEGPERRA